MHSVIRAPRKVDLAQLSEDFQHQVVAIFPLDLRHQGQQQIPGAGLVGGQCQSAGTLQIAGDRHGCIINPLPGVRTGQPGRRTCE